MNHRSIALHALGLALLVCSPSRMPLAQADPAASDIRTPPAAPAPRINGASVFGVRPGAPFLYRIPATGERPMEFSVERLPSGLTVENSTGQISGTLPHSGTFDIVLRARNMRGTDSRKFRIVVGEDISLTPALGWNSWNVWGGKVTGENVIQSARAMVSSGLIDHGWTYINIDDSWQGRRGGAFHGIQGNEKFPDMKGLCDAIHTMGLKVGIYSTPWTTSYATYIGGSAENPEGKWSPPTIPRKGNLNKKILPWAIGTYSFAKADAKQWAAWGIDYLKYDWNPNEVPETAEMKNALRGCGRDIIFSLSNNTPYSNIPGIAPLANSWRTTGDIRDTWGSVSRIGFSQDKWAPYAGPAHWNDPDMLVVGFVGWGNPRPSNLTHNEQYTHITLWCLLSSPLLLGCDMEKLDAFTLNLLTNDEVLAVDQDPLGKEAVSLSAEGEIRVYVKPLEDGTKAVGLFNLSDHDSTISLRWSHINLPGPQEVRDLWRQKALGVYEEEFTMSVGPHGAELVMALILLCAATYGQESEQRTRRSTRVVPMQEVDVFSPDSSVVFSLLPNAERLSFRVMMGNSPAILTSPIVMKVDGYDLSSGVVCGGLERYSIDETYPMYGAHSIATNRCNGARVSLQHDLSFATYQIDIRVFNDGIAFRHIVPEEGEHVPDEYTTFVVPPKTTVWYADMDGHYEGEYKRRDVDSVQPGEWAGPPVTFMLPDNAGYASITEANLVNYSGMALEADGRRGWITGLGHRQPLNWPFELRYGREEGKRLGRPASVTGTITTPWRVVILGKDLNTLVNSTILMNLCPPPDATLFPQGLATPWVRPGRAVWRYVDGGDRSFNGLKEFSRLGGLLGFRYHVIEGVWNRWTMEQRKEMVEYSKQQGVRLLFWKHSRDLRTPAAREEFFTMLADLGVAGAKVDFFDHEAKEVVDVYEDILRCAARHKILVVFHGSNKPTGRTRTWPNELVRESIRGMESGRLMDRAGHQTVLPFTRYLAGPADYTTMIFSERRRNSSAVHQIASMAVFSSPLLTISAHPQSILDNPAVDVIKSIPPVWDQTIVLPQSRIGELVVVARKTGTTWFLAVMNGGKARALSIPTDFLSPGAYAATFVRDNLTDDAAESIDHAVTRRGESVAVALRDGGGFVARFERK
jgi:alpha-glucosidase